MRAWELTADVEGLLNARQARAVTDGVWRRAARCEAGAALGGTAVCALLDLAKAYEMVPRRGMADAMHRHGCPAYITAITPSS